MSNAQYTPGMEEGRWTAQPWGEQPVEHYPESATDDWLEVAARAQAVREDAARQMVKDAYDEIERNKNGEQGN